MSAPPPDSDPLPDDDDLEDFEEDLDDLDGPGDADPSGEAASDPESARQEAEDALAEIEALADLDEDLDVGDESPSGEASSSDRGPTADASAEGASERPAGTAEASEAGPPEDQCENCGALLHGPYCSQCGQKAADRIVPVWHMINEALEAVVELDLRVLYTLPKFLFLPGRLTKEYLNGRRKRYIRPFRLYLFSTFVLFAVIALTTTGTFGLVLDPQGMARLNPPNTGITLSGGVDSLAAASPPAADSTAAAGAPTAPSTDDRSPFGDPERRKKLANDLRSDSTSVQFDLYDDPEANARMERLLRVKAAQAVENPWEAVGSMIDRGPYLMFLLLPIFAFLLKLLYVRRGRLYMEHMIFSLHVHALAFFAFTVGLLLRQSDVGWLDASAPWVEASPLLYLVLALSHVYEQGLLKSALKALILLSIYSVVLSIGFLVLAVVAVLFM
jgi:hypothetical protein